MAVIDLGELHQADQPLAPAPPRRPAPRLPLLVAVLLVALAPLVASTPLPVRDALVIPAPLGSDRIVHGELVLVVNPPERIGGDRSVTAYQLSSGVAAWRAPLPISGEFRGFVVGADLLFLTGYDARSRLGLTVALDPATGAQRWQQPGFPLRTAGAGLILENRDYDGTETLRAVDACCGALRWQEGVPRQGPAYGVTDAGVDRVVLTYPSGVVSVLDAETGAQLVAADLAGVADLPAGAIQVAAGLLLVVDGTRVTAYGLDRLDRRWQASVPGAVTARECGGAVCLQSRAGSLRALDAASGRPLWRLDGRNNAWELGGRLLVARIGVTGTGRPDLAVLDPATGRARVELGRWELARSSRPDGPLIGVRPHPGGGLFVAELDTPAGAVRPLDVLPGAAGDCEVTGGHLLCRRHDGSLGRWPLDR